jgi:fatty acid desaturase
VLEDGALSWQLHHHCHHYHHKNNNSDDDDGDDRNGTVISMIDMVT